MTVPQGRPWRVVHVRVYRPVHFEANADSHQAIKVTWRLRHRTVAGSDQARQRGIGMILKP